MYQSSGPMVSYVLSVSTLIGACLLGGCMLADSKMQLLKESVALDSISGKEYDVGFVSS